MSFTHAQQELLEHPFTKRIYGFLAEHSRAQTLGKIATGIKHHDVGQVHYHLTRLVDVDPPLVERNAAAYTYRVVKR
jgi:hypothetical protein